MLPLVAPGASKESRLLRAVTRTRDGGYADTMPLFASHADKTVIFGDPAHDAAYQAVARWIDSTQIGPGIEVGILVVDRDGLIVGECG